MIVPVGGGGLISGVAFAIKSLNPNCKVYGVQASGAASMKEAISHHQIAALERVRTFADGIAVKCPGDLTYEMVNQYVDDLSLIHIFQHGTLNGTQRAVAVAEHGGTLCIDAKRCLYGLSSNGGDV